MLKCSLCVLKSERFFLLQEMKLTLFYKLRKVICFGIERLFNYPLMARNVKISLFLKLKTRALLNRERHKIWWWWWIRDGWPHQNGWIFGKIPNGLWPPPSFSENYIADFATKVRDFVTKVRDFATKVRDFATKVHMFILAGLLDIIWSYFPWDA